MTDLVFAFNDKDQVKMLLDQGKTNLLISYYYLNVKNKEKMINLLDYIKIRRGEQTNPGVFMLDSGAFSAWNNGDVVNLYDYIDFIKEYHKYFTHIVCLDIINNPIYSEINHLIMLEELKNYNLGIIPVFHSGEPFSVLDYMVEQGYNYLGISPNNNWMEQTKREWLTRVFQRHNFDKLGIKTHGFGYQSVDGLAYFPLTTSDAITWVIASAYGRIVDDTGMSLKFSNQVIGKVDHIDSIPGGYSKFVLELCQELGMDIETLRDDYRQRRIFNIHALDRLTKREKNDVSMSPALFDIEENLADFDRSQIGKLYNEAREKGREYTGSPSLLLPPNKRRFAKNKPLPIEETLF